MAAIGVEFHGVPTKPGTLYRDDSYSEGRVGKVSFAIDHEGHFVMFYPKNRAAHDWKYIYTFPKRAQMDRILRETAVVIDLLRAAGEWED